MLPLGQLDLCGVQGDKNNDGHYPNMICNVAIKIEFETVGSIVYGCQCGRDVLNCKKITTKCATGESLYFSSLNELCQRSPRTGSKL